MAATVFECWECGNEGFRRPCGDYVCDVCWREHWQYDCGICGVSVMAEQALEGGDYQCDVGRGT